jgi:PAS domain S-box-containing protein
MQKAADFFKTRGEQLERAYAGLQEDVKRINLELDSKNVQLERSLRKQEETQSYLTSILASMNSGVVGVDVRGRITHFNPAASAITGYEVDEVMGQHYSAVFSREAESAYSPLRALSSGRELQRDEKVVWRKDGQPVPVSFQTALLRDTHDGATLGAVEIFSDVSGIKALEEEMRRAKTMAALGEMAATVAHEIRNPLGAMGVWVGLLERDLEPEDPRRKTVGKVLEGLSRLNRIVSNLLVYSRPIKASLRSVPLKDFLSEIVDFVQIEIERQEHKIGVVRSFERSVDVHVSVDPEKMHQVILNLCLNAIQAMPGGGTLSVLADAAAGSEFVSFAIADTGIGIEPDKIGKVFDPFFTTKENGTGLGLAIVKRFVEFHSGHITVDSTPGVGTTMKVFLPRAVG